MSKEWKNVIGEEVTIRTGDPLDTFDLTPSRAPGVEGCVSNRRIEFYIDLD